MFLKLFFLLVLAGSSFSSLRDFLEPAKLKEKVHEEIAKLDIGFDLKILDTNLTDSLGIAARYRYEVEPSYEESWYSRIDKWKFGFAARPGELLKDVQLPLSLNIAQDAEVLFVRQFKSQKEALKALPYSLKRMPIRAKWALENLEPGDFVSIPTTLNISLGASASAKNGFLNASLGTHYLLSGQFHIHIFRMKDNRVRVKLIALRSKGTGASASVNADFKIFAVSFIDKQIKKFLDTNLLSVGIHQSSGDLFLLDYIFDLDDAQASKAYDEIFASTLKFKNLSILDPFQSKRDLQDSLISDLSLTEDLFIQDREKPILDRRVIRLFKGVNDYETSSNSLKLGMNLLKFSRNENYTENFITWIDSHEGNKHYLFPTWTKTWATKFLFGFSSSQRDETMFSLFSADANGVANDFSDVGYGYDAREKRLWGWECKQWKEKIERQVSPALFPLMTQGEFAKNEKRENSRLSVQVFFHKEAFLQLLSRDWSTLDQDLLNYLHSVPLPQVAQTNGDGPQETWQDQNSHSLYKMKKLIAEAFLQDLDLNTRINRFMLLRKNDAFMEVGSGFLISLLDPSTLQSSLHVQIRWTAKDTNTMEWSYGTHQQSGLYKELMAVQAILNNRSYDLRLSDQEIEDLDQKVEKVSKAAIFDELYPQEP